MNTNFNLSSATMLSKSEMKSVKGGVPVKEYCDILQTIARGEYWSPQEWDNWSNVYETHCMK